MMQKPSSSTSGLIYYRLIALWVLCEALLGGIIHGLKIPVSGLVVGSCAIVCICLIAWYVPHKGAILKATLIVAIFKMMLSPHASLPAYIAVFFQGAMGELLFRNRKFFRVSCILLAVLGLLESGLQRILVLTIVYGNDLWKVINDFINGLTRQKIVTNYSWWIASGYVAVHFITGIFVGWWASILPARVERWSREKNYRIPASASSSVLPIASRKRRWLKKGLFIVWIIFIILYVQSYFSIGKPLLPSYTALKILLRSFIIVLSWIFIIGPLLKQLLHEWLKKKQSRSRHDIQQVFALLPATQTIITQSWKRSVEKKGRNRFLLFSRIVLVNALYPGGGNKTFILTGPVQTGKTSSLIDWSQEKKDVSGILTPLVNGKRFFKDVKTGEQFSMEALPDETEIVTVGRYAFSKKNFEKATNIIRDANLHDGWLVIDEIGPLELSGQGFSDVLSDLITTRIEPLLIVVREGLAEKVIEHFGINNAVIISSITKIEK